MDISRINANKKIYKIILLLIIVLFGFKKHQIHVHSYPTQASSEDGNIPVVDVQMVAQKRWLVSSKEFKNLQKELSYFVDQEIEKEKKRLMDMEDARFHDMQKSFIQLIPNSRGKMRNKAK